MNEINILAQAHIEIDREAKRLADSVEASELPEFTSGRIEGLLEAKNILDNIIKNS